MSTRRVAVVTVSDGVTRGTREDASGELAGRILVEAGFELAAREVVPDEREEIEGVLRRLAGAGHDVIVTTGGTGFGPRDVTPEATRAVLDVEAPGIGELMRAAGLAHTPLASLARQSAGRRGRTIVVNLPGSVKGATESLDAVIGVLAHACATAAGGVRP